MSSFTSNLRESHDWDSGVEDKQCIFRIGQARFSVPAVSVREIAPQSPVAPVPVSHPALAGLCHVRSEFVPVLRLGQLLQDSSADDTTARKLVVIECVAGRWALRVDAVVALEALETLIHPDYRAEISQGPVARSPVLGTATCRDEIVRVLDPNRVFRLAQELLLESWQSPAVPFPLATPPTRSDS